ncbi:MAG: carboxypeptidase-like regulatory domain-containing protein [Terriglobia bacterium]
MSRKISFWLAVCLLALLTPLGLKAQVTTATIYGSMTDRSGDVIPGAQVAAVNTGTNLTRTVKTNAEGEYRIELLPVGHYAVTASAMGFEKSVRQGIVLTINQTALVNVTLDVGRVSQSVGVTAAPPMVNTSNATIGWTVENLEITNLPIVNRNVYTLLSLTSGVQSPENSVVLGYPEQRTMINGGVDGGAGSVTYYRDGGVNMIESTNAFNWVDLGSPGETLSSSNFGVITGAQDMREIQLGLRLTF